MKTCSSRDPFTGVMCTRSERHLGSHTGVIYDREDGATMTTWSA